MHAWAVLAEVWSCPPLACPCLRCSLLSPARWSDNWELREISSRKACSSSGWLQSSSGPFVQPEILGKIPIPRVPLFQGFHNQRGSCNGLSLGWCFSTFLVLHPFKTVLHVAVTLNHKIIKFLLHNFNYVTARNCNVTMWYAGYPICDPQGIVAHRLRTTYLACPHSCQEDYKVIFTDNIHMGDDG